LAATLRGLIDLLNNWDLSGHYRAIKPSQVVVLWSFLILACKTVCHRWRLPPCPAISVQRVWKPLAPTVADRQPDKLPACRKFATLSLG
jgi:hypothetical protein